MKRTIALAEQFKAAHQLDHRVISLSLDEQQIPSFLNTLMQAGVSYATIQIKEPSLEDYFLKITEKNK
jgi:ABC-type multidrug transport system ATPase subunit